jgi:hypothetical protein
MIRAVDNGLQYKIGKGLQRRQNLHVIPGIVSKSGRFCFSRTHNSPTFKHTLNAGHLRVLPRLDPELGSLRIADTGILEPGLESQSEESVPKAP